MPDILERLQAGTHELRLEVEWMKAWRGEGTEAAREHLRHLQLQLSRCGDLIREVQSQPAPELPGAIREYRECLQRLQEALPVFEKDLLAHRSGMEAQRAHCRAASNWAQCSKNTI